MDFASLMKSQIAGTQNNNASNKYVRRSDAEAARREAYDREQAEQEAARLARLEKKRKFDEDEAERKRVLKEKKQKLAEESQQRKDQEEAVKDAERRKRLGLPERTVEIPVEQLKADEEDINDGELKEKLAALHEPRILFGETHVQRLRRYRDLTAAVVKWSNGPIPTTIELVEEKDMRLNQVLPKDHTAKLYVKRQLASYFDMILREWARALSARPKDVKESQSGKQAHNNFTIAVSNLVSLFRKLESPDMPDDLLRPIVEIAHLAQSKRYVDANDAYLRLSIGKAAWPIGVTMVGIHERSAREKLHEDGTAAHIMSDEATRKMIQGIKRSLTFAQTRWPPDEIGQLMG